MDVVLTDRYQRHESLQDQTNQQDVIDAVLMHWGCDKAHKIDESRSYGLDYALSLRGLIRFFVEVKCRRLRKGYGDGYYIGLRKIMQARAIREACGLPCLLVVCFTGNELCWVPLDRPCSQVKWFGWNEPRDARDWEPCAVIPWSRFNPLIQIPGG